MELFGITKIKEWDCRKLGQLFFICFISGIHSTSAQDNAYLKIGYLNPFSEVERVRTPSAHVPNDSVDIAPTAQESWTANILVEDDAGVLASVRDNLRQWQETEQYRDNWNLEKTGLYGTPDRAGKIAYLNRELLRYLDKRLSGEVNKAEEGSALHSVGQVQKALKPAAEAQVSEKVKLKFKARVLQGEAIVKVDNPWVEYRTNINRQGDINMNAAKEIKTIGVKTNVDYNVSAGQWVASFDKPLNEKLTARVSSAQSDKQMAFEEQTDRTVQFIFNTPF